MSFPFTECRDIVLQDLIAALSDNRARLAGIVSADQERPILSGVSFDVLPWHQFVCVSFRKWGTETSDLESRYSPADWELYEFIGDGHFDKTREYTAALYQSPPSGMPAAHCAHLIYTAAAEAILDPAVATELQASGVDAPVIADDTLGDSFEFMVLDEDKVITSNYCDVLIASRLTRRLLD